MNSSSDEEFLLPDCAHQQNQLQDTFVNFWLGQTVYIKNKTNHEFLNQISPLLHALKFGREKTTAKPHVTKLLIQISPYYKFPGD